MPGYRQEIDEHLMTIVNELDGKSVSDMAEADPPTLLEMQKDVMLFSPTPRPSRIPIALARLTTSREDKSFSCGVFGHEALALVLVRWPPSPRAPPIRQPAASGAPAKSLM
jgi:hypothetical protein